MGRQGGRTGAGEAVWCGLACGHAACKHAACPAPALGPAPPTSNCPPRPPHAQGDEMTERFLRIMIQLAVQHCLRSEAAAAANLPPGAPRPAALSFIAVDAAVRLFVCLITQHGGGNSLYVKVRRWVGVYGVGGSGGRVGLVAVAGKGCWPQGGQARAACQRALHRHPHVCPPTHPPTLPRRCWVSWPQCCSATRTSAAAASTAAPTTACASASWRSCRRQTRPTRRGWRTCRRWPPSCTPRARSRRPPLPSPGSNWWPTSGSCRACWARPATAAGAPTCSWCWCTCASWSPSCATPS